jgi:hypothetical protein
MVVCVYLTQFSIHINISNDWISEDLHPHARCQRNIA